MSHPPPPRTTTTLCLCEFSPSHVCKIIIAEEEEKDMQEAEESQVEKVGRHDLYHESYNESELENEYF